MYSAYSVFIIFPSNVLISTLPFNIEIFLFLSKEIFFDLISMLSASKLLVNKTNMIANIIYFSLIWITPINANRLKTMTGTQTETIKGILSVWPSARENLWNKNKTETTIPIIINLKTSDL